MILARDLLRFGITIALLANTSEPIFGRTAAAMPGRLSPADKASCRAGGGKVMREGLAGLEGCVVRFADGGHACKDARQCQGICEYHGDWLPKAGTAVGQCAIDNVPFGCRSTMTRGHPSEPRCID